MGDGCSVGGTWKGCGESDSRVVMVMVMVRGGGQGEACGGQRENARKVKRRRIKEGIREGRETMGKGGRRVVEKARCWLESMNPLLLTNGETLVPGTGKLVPRLSEG